METYWRRSFSSNLCPTGRTFPSHNDFYIGHPLTLIFPTSQTVLKRFFTCFVGCFTPVNVSFLICYQSSMETDIFFYLFSFRFWNWNFPQLPSVVNATLKAFLPLRDIYGKWPQIKWPKPETCATSHKIRNTCTLQYLFIFMFLSNHSIPLAVIYVFLLPAAGVWSF